ncbi:squalene epoxidase-domain-containing protein [Gigaspora rosea]|uniref:Squalene monooxygenase n=1 Tax=Gigaspora rosea TaxID=44941 RepID=A0A397UDZ5_9GLOM|nr:squalene epoxidase-domain-containing protein [Gigaspora rosea]
MSLEYDLIIIGAGIVGCVAAVAFGKQGRKVLLIERDMSEPNRIVGEYLQPGGVVALEKLGLSECLENIDSIPCYGYGVFYGGETVSFLYPNVNGKPARGRSFHHGRFIMNLRNAASKISNVTICEAMANDIISCPLTERALGVICTPKGESDVRHFYAPLTIIADGCFSKFRKDFILRDVQVKSNFVGLIMKDAVLPYPNHGHVILANSPVLMYQIGTHETRVLIDIPGKLPSNGSGELKKYIENNVLPFIPKSVQPSLYEALQTERLRSMPNSFLPPSTNVNGGLIILGDAMNMRHPLTGGGMTVGFCDIVILSDLLSPAQTPDFNDTGLILAQLQVFHWKRKFYCSTVINVLAQALYSLVAAADDEYLRIMREACFNYFKFGGICINHPCGMLAGLFPNPLLLVFHFFAVAIYGVYRIFREDTILHIPQNILKSFIVIYTACVVILPVLWTELKF